MPVFERPKFYSLSEKSVTVEFGDSIDEALFMKVTTYNLLLKQHPFPGMGSTVPAYATLTVFFDPLLVMKAVNMSGGTCHEKVTSHLRQININDGSGLVSGNEITIPVCYGGEEGPDLEELAAMHQLPVDRVIDLHSSAVYKVYMIGFVPGFAYLGGLPEILASPRRQLPRANVPAGSVGIAGRQTGIYPFRIPGGWQIVGRTPVELFNPGRDAPAFLKAGDRVRFLPISLSEFKSLSGGYYEF